MRICCIAALKKQPRIFKLLRSPVINSDKKQKVVEAVTAGKVSELTCSFIKLADQ